MRVLYVSYDGALDPLGATQVIPYLQGLSRLGARITLISFEKPARWGDAERREVMSRRLEEAGVDWRPLVYHKRPRVPATLWDLVRGTQAIRRTAVSGESEIVHCRGDLAMTMARSANLPRSMRMLYDMRGLFSAERVEGGSWRAGGLVDRWVKRAERANRRRADGIVVLTEHARAWLEQVGHLQPQRVIPTCVDTERFRPRRATEPAEFGLAYVGSLGTWYMAREMADFCRRAAAVVPQRALFLTPDTEEARRAGIDGSWAVVRAVSPDEVPHWLCRARALICFVRPTFSKTFSFPTKVGEGLAAGLPVIANRGIGDLDALIQEHSIGTLLRGFDEDCHREALERLREVLEDPSVGARCRDFAQSRLSVNGGVHSYYELYEQLLQRLEAPLPGGRRLV